MPSKLSMLRGSSKEGRISLKCAEQAEVAPAQLNQILNCIVTPTEYLQQSRENLGYCQSLFPPRIGCFSGERKQDALLQIALRLSLEVLII